MSISTHNPATGRRLRAHHRTAGAEAWACVERAAAAVGPWRERGPTERARALRSVAAALHRRREFLARLATDEMGKPLAQSRAEVEKCRMACLYYARHGASLLRDERPPGSPRGSRVVYEPLGVLLAVMPWNFPYWQVFRAAAPALMAGNTILLKHAENVTGCARAIERVFAEARVPRGVLQTLVVSDAAVGRILADPRIAAVTLTGSVAAGEAVGRAAGSHVKKSVLELGGSDPYIVLADADIARAAEVCAASRLINSGQSCVCAKRFIVVRSVLAAFEAAFTRRMAARKVGSPLDPSVDVGPLARADLRAALDRQVRSSVRAGAKVLLGGRPVPGRGYFYEPTVLTRVGPGMAAYSEELFGPVASIISVRDEEEAIRVANDTQFGLGAAVFTRSRAAAARVAGAVQTGIVFVNDLVRSDPSLPFGGVKKSGHGRELGPAAVREFANAKTIVGPSS